MSAPFGMQDTVSFKGIIALLLLYFIAALSHSFGGVLYFLVAAFALFLWIIPNPFARKFIVFIVATLILFGSILIPMQERLTIHSQSNTSDQLIAIEAATITFLSGGNPYVSDYFGTELEKLDKEEQSYWAAQGVDHNPALYHFVYLPAAFLIPASFYSIIGTFDLRILFCILLFLVLVLGYWYFSHTSDAEIFLPVMLILFVFGQYRIGVMDVPLLGLVLLAGILTYQQKHTFAVALWGLLGAIKITIWPILFFVLLWAYFSEKKIYYWIPIISFAITLPFLIYSGPAFLDDTLFYILGSSPHPYPATIGMGLPSLLTNIGLNRGQIESFPFWIVQLLVGGCLLYWGINKLKQKMTMSTVFLVSGIILLGVTLTFRIFQFNYANFAIGLIVLGFFQAQKELEVKHSFQSHKMENPNSKSIG